MSATDNAASTLQNAGTLTVAQDANILIPILNLGQLEIGQACRFGTSSYSQIGNSSQTLLDGGTLIGDAVAINEGTIRGSGTVSLFSVLFSTFLHFSPLFSTFLHFSPLFFYYTHLSAPLTNNGTCSVDGPFLVNGTFVQTKDARLVITIYGNSSLLTITGNATLNGILQIR
jgi:hypothetical protein